MMCRNKQKIVVFSIVLCFIVLLTFALSGCTKNAAEYAIYTNTFEEVNQAAFIIAQNALNTEPYLNEIHGRATDEITDLQLVYKDGKKRERLCFVTLRSAENTLDYSVASNVRGFSRKIHHHTDKWEFTFDEMINTVKKYASEHNIKSDSIDFWASPVYENVLVIDLIGSDNSRYRVNANMESGAIYEGMTQDVGLWGYVK